MRLPIVLVLSCAVLAGCSSPLTGVAGACAVLVKIDGTILARAGVAAPADLGPQYATVQENRGCEDVIEVVDGQPTTAIAPFENGQSSGVPAGTALHLFNGFAPTERLIAVSEDQELFEFRRVQPAD